MTSPISGRQPPSLGLDSVAAARAKRRPIDVDPSELEARPEAMWRFGIRVVLWIIVTPLWVWALLAVLFFDPWPMWVLIVLSLGWGLATPLALIRMPRVPVVIMVLVGVLMVRFLWSYQIASNDRVWAPLHARMPGVKRQGPTVRIHNMRSAAPGAQGDQIEWYSQRFNLNTIVSADLVAQPLNMFRPVSHAMLTFGFRNGDHVAVSVEARRESGESFSVLKGLFRQYELVYVIGDERDLIGRRAAGGDDPIFVYPLRVTPDEARALFESTLEQAVLLIDEPRYYDPIRNNCTMNLIRHLEAVTAVDVRNDWRGKVPGYADDLANELGLIATELSLEDARKQAYINHRTTHLDDPRMWSKQIRGRLADDP